MNAKFRDIYALEGPHLDREACATTGFDPDDIDIVINTHLHFDHCGGNTRIEKDKVVPTFPNARYVVQRGEFEHAKHPTERDRASYIPENYVPLEAAGQLSLLEGDREIAPGVELIRVPGHTANMHVREAHRRRQDGVSVRRILVPTTAHLPLPWIMGYDLYPLTTLENKKKWIPQVVQRRLARAFRARRATSGGVSARAQTANVETEPVRRWIDKWLKWRKQANRRNEAPQERSR